MVEMEEEIEYYDGTKLLSLKDQNGETPEIYISTSNRSGGKTTFFGRWVINRWLKKGSKFGLIYRFNYELDGVEDKFFKDIRELFFPEYNMIAHNRAKGIYKDLLLNDRHCGYAISLNSADTLKKYSHLFSDIDVLLFDEFQSETNHYCNDEVKKLISIHTSIARGQGKQVRYVPIIMIGNPVTLLNPYYVSLGITERLTDQVKFLRGNGFVLEQGYIKSAGKAQTESAFNRAFANEQYVAYSSQAIYLNDLKTFIETPQGKSTYSCTIKFMGNDYAIREYRELGIVYCDDKADSTFPIKISVTTADHNVNYVMLKQYQFLIDNLRFYFERGCFRFKNMKCKQAILNAISY